MNDLEIMNRMEEIEEQLKPLYQLEREKEKIKHDCNHNIIILLNSNSCCSIDAFCLFCGKKYETNRELYGQGEIIDISEYYCVFLSDNKMISAAKKICKNIASQNQHVESKELANMIKEKFKDEYYETKVVIEEMYRKARKEE